MLTHFNENEKLPSGSFFVAIFSLGWLIRLVGGKNKNFNR
jgi:hypothetical protein